MYIVKTFTLILSALTTLQKNVCYTLIPVSKYKVNKVQRNTVQSKQRIQFSSTETLKIYYFGHG